MITNEKLANLLGQLAAPIKGGRMFGYVRKNGCPVLGRDATTAYTTVKDYLLATTEPVVDTHEYGKVLRMGVMVGETNYSFTIHEWRTQ